MSGGKVTAALFTGGVSLFATRLSKKENSTQAHCANCKNVWEFWFYGSNFLNIIKVEEE
jgi:hypothetical protein